MAISILSQGSAGKRAAIPYFQATPANMKAM